MYLQLLLKNYFCYNCSDIKYFIHHMVTYGNISYHMVTYHGDICHNLSNTVTINRGLSRTSHLLLQHLTNSELISFILLYEMHHKSSMSPQPHMCIHKCHLHT